MLITSAVFILEVASLIQLIVQFCLGPLILYYFPTLLIFRYILGIRSYVPARLKLKFSNVLTCSNAAEPESGKRWTWSPPNHDKSSVPVDERGWWFWGCFCWCFWGFVFYGGCFVKVMTYSFRRADRLTTVIQYLHTLQCVSWRVFVVKSCWL